MEAVIGSAHLLLCFDPTSLVGDSSSLFARTVVAILKIFGYRLHSFQGRREKINFPLIRVFLQTQLNRHHEPPQTLADRKAVLTVTPVGLSWAGVWFLWPRRIPGACSFPTTSFPGLNLSVLKTKLRTVEPHEICHPGGTKRLRLWSSLPRQHPQERDM